MFLQNGVEFIRLLAYTAQDGVICCHDQNILVVEWGCPSYTAL